MKLGNLVMILKVCLLILKKRIEEMEELASDVSHELKNPLAGLKSATDLLQTKKIR